MATTLFIVIVVLVANKIVHGGDLICAENEIFEFCKSPYQPSCQALSGSAYDPFWCLPGCVCQPGWIRDDFLEKCVLPSQCSKSCPINEEQNYYQATYCEPICQSDIHDYLCVLQNKKCFCKQGFFRDLNTGECVSQENCPNKFCSLNQIWVACINPYCRRTCQNRFRTDYVCIPLCESGCICTDGYLWDEISETCVPEQLCPNHGCGINEEWSNNTSNHCRRTCENIGKPLNCSLRNGEPGCICQNGFIWDEKTKRCVLEKDCPKECGENEEWTACSDEQCRPTCQRWKHKECTEPFTSGCSCIDGFIWDEHYKKCVREQNCSKECGKHQVWSKYIPNNIPTCRNLFDQYYLDYRDSISPNFRPGCICIDNYIWDEISEKCVLPKNCYTVFNITTVTGSKGLNTQSTFVTNSTKPGEIETTFATKGIYATKVVPTTEINEYSKGEVGTTTKIVFGRTDKITGFKYSSTVQHVSTKSTSKAKQSTSKSDDLKTTSTTKKYFTSVHTSTSRRSTKKPRPSSPSSLYSKVTRSQTSTADTIHQNTRKVMNLTNTDMHTEKSREPTTIAGNTIRKTTKNALAEYLLTEKPLRTTRGTATETTTGTNETSERSLLIRSLEHVKELIELIQMLLASYPDLEKHLRPLEKLKRTLVNILK